MITMEEWNKLPPYMRRNLQQEGIYPQDMDKVSDKGQPVTNFGIMNSPEYSRRLPEGYGGFTMIPEKPELPTSDRSSVRILNKTQIEKDPKEAFITRAHEAEHALIDQGRGEGSDINPMWDSMVSEKDARRGEIVNRLVKNSDYLVKNWGLSPGDAKRGYFSPKVLPRSDSHNFLYEQMATLSALEQQQGKRFVEDPYVRKHILKTPGERETYEALTGLRQTRLDAKDLPPYTRQPGSTSIKSDPDVKEDDGFMAKIKSMLNLQQDTAAKKK